jgi:hypothetical protein
MWICKSLYWGWCCRLLMAAALFSASRVWAVSPTWTSFLRPTKTINSCGLLAPGPYGPDPAPNRGDRWLVNSSSIFSIESSSGPETYTPVVGYSPSGKGSSPHWFTGSIPASFAVRSSSPHRKYASPSFLYERKTMGLPWNCSNPVLSPGRSRIDRAAEKFCAASSAKSSIEASLVTAAAFLPASLAALSARSAEPCAFAVAVSALSASSCSWLVRSSLVFWMVASRSPRLASIRSSPTMQVPRARRSPFPEPT